MTPLVFLSVLLVALLLSYYGILFYFITYLPSHTIDCPTSEEFFEASCLFLWI